jgi:hypothetical protein
MKQFQFLLFLSVLLFLPTGCSFFRRAAPAEIATVAGVTPTATSLVRGLQPTFTATPLPPVATTPAGSAPLLAVTATAAPPTPTSLLAPVLAPRGGVLTNVQYLDTVAAAQIDELSATFYPANNQIPARYDIDRYQLTFQTVDENDQPVVVRAELFFPRLTAWAAFPVLVYGAGTTGIGANCAPLDEWMHGRNWGNYRTHMLSYAAQGMIAILPLWQGYDDTARTHPYFVARLEGYLLLDAARAVYNFFASPAPGVLAQPLDALFFGGYSQGGHGAFAADQFASWYAPELTVKGVIGHATAPSVEALLRERPPLAPYIVHAYSSYYGPYVIAPESVFLPQWLPTFAQDVTSKCVDEVYQYYPVEPDRLYRPEFLNALYGGQLENGFAAFKQVLDLNYAGSAINPATPAVLLHGAVDPIVTTQTNEAFMTQICALGKRVTYFLYPEVNHFATRQHAFADTLRWMQEILNGGTPRSDCPGSVDTDGG